MRFIEQNIGFILLIGVALVLCGTLMGVVASRRNSRIIRYPSVLVILLGCGACVVGLAVASLTGQWYWASVALVAGVLMGGLGLMALILEMRRGAPVKQGGLTMAAGLLLSVSSLFLPILPGQLAPIAVTTATPTALTPTRTPVATRTPVVSLTPTVSPTFTQTPTALPSLTPTNVAPLPPTRPPVDSVSQGTAQVQLIGTNNIEQDTVTAVASPRNTAITTPTAVSATNSARAALCTLVPYRNVNLRAEPSIDSLLLETIPYGTQVQGLAQTPGWWRVRYDGREGWMTADYVTVTDTAARACEALPTRQP